MSNSLNYNHNIIKQTYYLEFDSFINDSDYDSSIDSKNLTLIFNNYLSTYIENNTEFLKLQGNLSDSLNILFKNLNKVIISTFISNRTNISLDNVQRVGFEDVSDIFNSNISEYHDVISRSIHNTLNSSEWNYKIKRIPNSTEISIKIEDILISIAIDVNKFLEQIKNEFRTLFKDVLLYKDSPLNLLMDPKNGLNNLNIFTNQIFSSNERVNIIKNLIIIAESYLKTHLYSKVKKISIKTKLYGRIKTALSERKTDLDNSLADSMKTNLSSLLRSNLDSQKASFVNIDSYGTVFLSIDDKIGDYYSEQNKFNNFKELITDIIFDEIWPHIKDSNLKNWGILNSNSSELQIKEYSDWIDSSSKNEIMEIFEKVKFYPFYLTSIKGFDDFDSSLERIFKNNIDAKNIITNDFISRLCLKFIKTIFDADILPVKNKKQWQQYERTVKDHVLGISKELTSNLISTLNIQIKKFHLD